MDTRVQQIYPLINRNTPLKHTWISTHKHTALLRPVLRYACPIWFAARSSHQRRGSGRWKSTWRPWWRTIRPSCRVVSFFGALGRSDSWLSCLSLIFCSWQTQTMETVGSGRIGTLKDSEAKRERGLADFSNRILLWTRMTNPSITW